MPKFDTTAAATVKGLMNIKDNLKVIFLLVLVVHILQVHVLFVCLLNVHLQVFGDRFYRQEQGPHLSGLHETPLQQVRVQQYNILRSH